MIKTEFIGSSIAIVTLMRQDKRNALNFELIDELIKTHDTLASNPLIRVLVITGDGPVFSSGMDLNEALNSELREKLAFHIAKLFKTLYSSSLVTIAAIQGDAVAGGAGIALACDMAIMSKEAKIGFPEVKRGLIAAQVIVMLLRTIKLKDIKELLFLGDLIDAKKCIEMGLVNRIIEKERVLQEAIEFANKIIKGGPQAIKGTKRLIASLMPGDYLHDLEQALVAYQSHLGSEEAKEGLDAFIEKRDPNW